MAATAGYKRVATAEDVESEAKKGVEDTSVEGQDDSFLYPGLRRTILEWGNSIYDGVSALNPGLNPNLMLVPTGGNALQAVDKEMASRSDVMRVVIPNSARPGQTMLVICPGDSGRLVTVTVPEHSYPGHVILVQIPPEPKSEMLVVTGAPVKDASPKDDMPLVPGRNISAAAVVANELELTESVPVDTDEKTANGKATTQFV